MRYFIGPLGERRPHVDGIHVAAADYALLEARCQTLENDIKIVAGMSDGPHKVAYLAAALKHTEAS